MEYLYQFRSTDELKVKYVEVYNKYMTLPDDSADLKELSDFLHILEQILTYRFLCESGYTVEEKGDFNIYVKK